VSRSRLHHIRGSLAEAGFGSYAGGLGYPLGITANTGSLQGLTDNNTLFAVADITGTTTTDARPFTRR